MQNNISNNKFYLYYKPGFNIDQSYIVKQVINHRRSRQKLNIAILKPVINHWLSIKSL